MSHVVIIGGGHAGGQLIASLRQQKFNGKITLISEESTLPYQRPPLSKAFLSGEQSVQQIALFPEKTYQEENMTCLLDTKVRHINSDANSIELFDNSTLHYDHLIIATGTTLRRLDIPGSTLKGIHYLKTLQDGQKLQSAMSSAKKMVIVGGGYIGLEIAATARKAGLDVSVLEMAPRILQRVVAPQVSEYFTRIHTEQGVNIITNANVQGFEGTGNVQHVVMTDGHKITADIVVVGIGVIPNDSLAKDACLACDNGILINEYCQTSKENIFAAGDCTNFFSAIYEKRIRLESVQNAVDQAKTIASYLVGNKKQYHNVPWFWSNQFTLRLQIAGLSQGFDEVITRGDKMSDKVSFFYLKNKRVIACDAINQAVNFMISKKLIESKKMINTEQLKNPDFSIKSLLN